MVFGMVVSLAANFGCPKSTGFSSFPSWTNGNCWGYTRWYIPKGYQAFLPYFKTRIFEWASTWPRISMDNLTYFLWFWTAFFWKLGRGIKWRRCLYVLFSELHACFEQNNQCPKLKIATLLPHDPVMFPFIHLGMAILVQFNASLPGVHQAWRLSKRVPGIWLGHVRIGFNYYSIFAKRTYHFSSTGAAFFGWFDRARLWESLRMFENEL